ncbi:pectate lyase [Kribbella sp. NPDC023855]|uniref:pectate lyase family protein n=1 Tax=Kribbella sp. NPDC023855 TaxID=3154698 RepID=UPI0033FAF06F
MSSSAPTSTPPRRRLGRAALAMAASAALVAAGSVAVAPEASAYTFALQGWATQGGGTTGGGSASPVTVTTQAALISNMQASGARVIRVSGTIALPSGMTKVASNKTIIGVGSGATITTGGINVSQVSNVIIRNINFRNWNDDAINVQYSTRVWIDHNNFSNGYDGAVDIKRASDYITVSWNRVFSHDKSFLLGHSDDNGGEDRGKLRVTYHHNYFDGSTQRHPRVRFANPVHVYNNYYRATSGYGVASTVGAGVFVQRNYFESVSKPAVAQTGDSSEGNLKLDGNYLVGSGTPVSRNPGSVAAIPYSFTLDAAADVKSIVTANAGTGKI